jgi:hypothetical protein
MTANKRYWTRWYWAVIAFLVIQILFFWWITRYFA